MTDSALAKRPGLRIPKVLCPLCGGQMGVFSIESAEANDGKITLDCRCGHQYELSEKALNSIARDCSDVW
jgi:hypothetical protein